MIKTFDQYQQLNEGKQVGVLYHYTTIHSLTKIIKENTLKTSLNSISFTRDKNFHKTYHTIGGTECRIVIDGDKLSDKYKIRPYNFFHDGSPGSREKNPYFVESEERLTIKGAWDISVKNLDKYVIAYEVFPYDKSMGAILQAAYDISVEELLKCDNPKIKILK